MSINDATAAVSEELAARQDMIVCRGVDKYYGDFQALKGVTATVKEREVVVVRPAAAAGARRACNMSGPACQGKRF